MMALQFINGPNCLRRRMLDERRMDSGSRFVELTVIGK
jgi:hypothetical protein